MRITADDAGVRRVLANGHEEYVRWDDLVEVSVRTLPPGSWTEDLYILLEGRGGVGCALPRGRVPEEVLPRLFALPGWGEAARQAWFDAMCSTEDRLFVCWRRPADNG